MGITNIIRYEDLKATSKFLGFEIMIDTSCEKILLKSNNEKIISSFKFDNLDQLDGFLRAWSISKTIFGGNNV